MLKLDVEHAYIYNAMNDEEKHRANEIIIICKM